MNEVFSAVDIRFSYGDVSILKGVGFSLAAGGMIAIAGRSGCGKSTLLEICAGLLAPDSGKVFLEGACMADLALHALVKVRQRIGYVFQKHALIHNFRIFENIALPLRYHWDMPERQVRATVKTCMEELGLFNVDNKFPNELSAGQARCAAIARALVMGPSVLFLDEPTVDVDPVTAVGITNVLREMSSTRGLAVVAVTNDIAAIKRLRCDVKVLDGGKLVDINDPTGAEKGAADMVSIMREAL